MRDVWVLLFAMTNGTDEMKIEWPPDMLPNERREMLDFLRAFDTATTNFHNDPTVIYPSEPDRLRLFFSNKKRWARVWSRPVRCMYEGCTEKSIPRSHSIPMSASLKLISEAGHVLTPQLGEDGVQMKRIGVREASTFPGFCERHESIFSEFETKGKMSSDRHYLFQTFRTLCREIFRMRRQKERIESALNEYRKFRREFILDRIEKARQPKSFKLEDVRFENDENERRAADTIVSISEDLPILEGLYRDLFYDIQNGTTESSLIVRHFDLRLPVCLSGLGILICKQDNTTKRAMCILAIIPEAQGTTVILCTAKEHMNALATYCSDESSPGFLAMMESWLCHGSDHWFIAPSNWHAIPESRQQAVLERILDPNPSIATPVEFSVLDSSRRKIIGLIELSLSGGDYTTSQLVELNDLLTSENRNLTTSLPIEKMARLSDECAAWRGQMLAATLTSFRDFSSAKNTGLGIRR